MGNSNSGRRTVISRGWNALEALEDAARRLDRELSEAPAQPLSDLSEWIEALNKSVMTLKLEYKQAVERERSRK